MAIYHVFFKSLIFIRQNVNILLPYFLFNILLINLPRWFSYSNVTTTWVIVYLILIALIYCLIETYIIAYVYVKEGVVANVGSIWQVVKKFYDQAVLLGLYFFLIYVLFGVIVRLFSVQLKEWVDLLLFSFTFFGYFILGLRHKIFYDTYKGSGIAGLKQLFSNFFFYFFIALPSVVILVWLSSLSILNWFGILSCTVLLSLISISFTFAFMFKGTKRTP